MPTTYTVKSGDNLSKIASQYGVKSSDISGYASGDPNKINVGENLSINNTPVQIQNSAVPTTPVNTASVSNLNQKPFDTSSGNVPTAATGLLGLIESTQKNIESLTPTIQNEEGNIKDITTKVAGQESKRAALYATEGVNVAQKELQQITQDMRARDLSYRRQVEQIQSNNPTGQLEQGQVQQINKLSTEHAREMADLAIVAEAKQGNFDSAKSIVDRKVDAETEGLKTQLNTLQYFYEKNSAQLTSAQKTLLEQKTMSVQNELNDKKELIQSLGNIQIEAAKNGAPTSVISAIGKAQNLSAGIVASGTYLGNALDDQYKKLQIQKLKQDISIDATKQANVGKFDANEIIAYAQQYASTGMLTGIPKEYFSLVSQAAKELPKTPGEIVDRNTGVRSSKLPAATTDAVAATYDIVSNLLPRLQDQYKKTYTGIVPGVLNKIGVQSSNMTVYNSLRTQFLNQLLVANSGKVVSDSELKRYQSLLPGTASNALFTFGRNGQTKIDTLKQSLEEKLNTNASSNGISIYGYSKVNLGGTDYTVGDVIQDSSGALGRVNADGSISNISQ